MGLKDLFVKYSGIRTYKILRSSTPSRQKRARWGPRFAQDFGGGLAPSTALRVTPAKRLNLSLGSRPSWDTGTAMEKGAEDAAPFSYLFFYYINSNLLMGQLSRLYFAIQFNDLRGKPSKQGQDLPESRSRSRSFAGGVARLGRRQCDRRDWVVLSVIGSRVENRRSDCSLPVVI